MKIHCQITPEDYLRALYLHIRPRPLLKWLGILGALNVVWVNIQLMLHPHKNEDAWIYYWLLGVIVFIIWKYAIALPKKTRRIYRQQKMLQTPYEAEITEESYEGESHCGKGKMAWKDFHKYKTGKDIVIVYQSDALFNMFPKRWFSDEEFVEFQSILHRQLGKPQP